MRTSQNQLLRFACVFFFFLAIHLSAVANVVVFRTYQDFENKRGETYDDYLGGVVQMGKLTMELSKGVLKENVKCSEIWGFTYNDKLFRVNRMGSPVLVISQGKVCFYENGVAHMEAMRKGKAVATVSSGFVNFISHDLKSTILEMPMGMGQIKKEKEAFIAEQPETSSLFECIGKFNDPDKTRECVKTFEGK